MKSLLSIVGPPGAGKDTQIERLSKRRNIDVIFVGDLVRKNASTNPNFAAALKSGDLADHNLVNGLTQEAIEGSKQDYIVIDGFPRDLGQANWLVGYLGESSIKFEGVMYIQLDDKEAVRRLLKRGREDDRKEIIEERIKIFHEQTGKVLDFFRSRGELTTIDGNGSVDDVVNNIKEKLGW